MIDAAGQQKSLREVDCRASKNRKVKFVVHDKIVNFLTPLDNLAILEGRDAIVKNLFGANSEVPKKRNKKRKQSDDVDEIALL